MAETTNQAPVAPTNHAASVKLCECGCGKKPTPGRRFVFGHHNRPRMKNPPFVPQAKPAPAPPVVVTPPPIATPAPSPNGDGDIYDPLRVIDAWDAGFNLGMVLMHVHRASNAPDAAEELKRARFYLDREIERQTE